MAWPLKETKQLTCDDYTVAWVCALPREKTAARNMLDELHHRPPQPGSDNNIYACGRIGQHNVVIVCQGDMGTTAAAVVANQLVNTFRNIRFGLLVGIAGGVPDKKDVRLGDVVISKGDGRSGGVVAHDRGKLTTEGLQLQSFLNGVPELLRNAFSELESLLMDHENPIPGCLAQAIERNPHFKAFERPGLDDHLFKSSYHHIDSENNRCEKCLVEGDQIVPRLSRGDLQHVPFVHFGTIASGNQVIKDGVERARIAARHPGVLAIEMEASGLMNTFGCATIRGICDYADSHKNDHWQNYAAAVAAATAKETLRIIPTVEKKETAVVAPDHENGYAVNFELPTFAVSSTFIQREELDQIEEVLLPTQPAELRRVFILYGVGGIGKTRLATEFARQHQNDFTAIFWVDGSTKGSASQSIAKILGRLPQQQLPNVFQNSTSASVEDANSAIKAVLTWLSQPANNRWLLIFDNVDRDWTSEPPDSDAFDIMDYFPQADHGSILVTTRLPHLAEIGDGLKIPRMDEKQSKEVLESRAGRPIPGWEQLAAALDGLPLALTLAGSYLRQHKLSAEKYLELYNNAFDRVFKVTRPPADYRRSILSTWQISFGQVKQANPCSIYLLQLWSCLSNTDLWFGLFTPAVKSESDHLPDWFKSSMRDELAFLDIMQPLIDYSLAEAQQSGSGYLLHPVIHGWSYTQVEEKNDMIFLALAVLGRAVPYSESSGEPWALRRRLLSHCDRIYHLIKAQEDFTGWNDRLIIVSWWCAEIGSLYRDLQQGDKAEFMYLQALNGYEKRRDVDDVAMFRTFNNLGGLYLWQVKLDKAEAMFRRSVQGLQRLLGPSHPVTLTPIHNLGLIYLLQDKLDNAESTLLEALHGGENAFGPDDIRTLKCITTLAAIYHQQGRLEEAEQLMERGHNGMGRALGLSHPLTLAVISDQALLYIDQGKMTDAERMLLRALDGFKMTMGPNHSSTFACMAPLGYVHAHLGNFTQAEQRYLEALEGYVKVPEPYRTDEIPNVYYLGELYRIQGRMQEAETMHRRALRAYKKLPNGRIFLRSKKMAEELSEGMERLEQTLG